MYHGSIEHRAMLRDTRMNLSTADALPKTAKAARKMAQEGAKGFTFPVVSWLSLVPRIKGRSADEEAGK